jgi:hypothetical protein
MTNRYAASANTATAELAADYADYRDKEVMQALVSADALVAVADGHLEDAPSSWHPASPPTCEVDAFDDGHREFNSVPSETIGLDELRIKRAEKIPVSDPERLHLRTKLEKIHADHPRALP